MLQSIITFAGRSISLGYVKPSAGSSPLSDTTPRAPGVIKGMSRRARNNLMRVFSRLPSNPTRFAVLNFPPDVPINPLFVRHAIKLLGQRLVRRFPDCSTIWRLEFQKNGAPHIHLAGNFDFTSEDLLVEFLFTAWREILGFDAPGPENIVFVSIPPDSELSQKVSYFCMVKESDEIGTKIYCQQYCSTGECCGHFNRVKANLAPVERRRLDEGQRKKIEAMLVASLKQRLLDVTPGMNILARQAFIDRVASGKDMCMNLQKEEFVGELRASLGDAA